MSEELLGIEPIEFIQVALEDSHIEIEEVLVPEECMIVVLCGKRYHLTITEVTENES